MPSAFVSPCYRREEFRRGVRTLPAAREKHSRVPRCQQNQFATIERFVCATDLWSKPPCYLAASRVEPPLRADLRGRKLFIDASCDCQKTDILST